MAAPGDRATWVAFLSVAFGVVGLVGVFASYAAPLPLERALTRDAALDAALAAGREPDPAAALARLRPALGDSAETVISGAAPLPERVAEARRRMHAAFRAEAADIGRRMRILIVVFTLAGALFGAAVLGAARRGG